MGSTQDHQEGRFVDLPVQSEFDVCAESIGKLPCGARYKGSLCISAVIDLRYDVDIMNGTTLNTLPND